MLDIVITHYNEPWDVGEKMFDILNLQRGIDFDQFRVLLIHDGTDPFPDRFVRRFKYKVDQIRIPHGGISAARNAGIEHSTATWVMFCDFDDLFCSVYALRDIMTVMPADNFDVLWGRVIQEEFVDGHDMLRFTPDQQNWVFMHGKIYRRQYLIDTGLRLNEDLVFNEDSEFNGRLIAQLPYQRIGEIKTQCPLYIWARRENSVTLSGREDEATWGHFNRNLSVTQAYKDHRTYDDYAGMVTRSAWDAWFMVQGHRISNDMKRKIMQTFVPWITERKNEFMKVEPDILDKIRGISRYELVDSWDTVPDNPELVSAWINTITRKDVNENGNTND